MSFALWLRKDDPVEFYFEGSEGSFYWKVARSFRHFKAITWQKILAKLVFQLGHFAHKSFAQIICSIIMVVAKWKRELCWLALTFFM